MKANNEFNSAVLRCRMFRRHRLKLNDLILTFMQSSRTIVSPIVLVFLQSVMHVPLLCVQYTKEYPLALSLSVSATAKMNRYVLYVLWQLTFQLWTIQWNGEYMKMLSWFIRISKFILRPCHKVVWILFEMDNAWFIVCTNLTQRIPLPMTAIQQQLFVVCWTHTEIPFILFSFPPLNSLLSPSRTHIYTIHCRTDTHWCETNRLQCIVT